MTPSDRERLLSNFYTRERNAGASALEANESMHFFAKRLDAAQARVADDKFSRDMAVLRSLLSRA